MRTTARETPFAVLTGSIALAFLLCVQLGVAHAQDAANAPAAPAQTQQPATTSTDKQSTDIESANVDSATQTRIQKGLDQIHQATKSLATKIGDYEKRFDRVREQDEKLATLRTDVDNLPAEAQKLINVLRPRLEDFRSQLKRFGEAPAEGAPPEAAQVAADRKRLNTIVAEIEGGIKAAKVATERARQLVTRIQEQRHALFAADLFTRTSSPLAPATWTGLGDELGVAAQRISAIATDWMSAAAPHATELVILILACLMIFLASRFHIKRFISRQFDLPEYAKERPGFMRRAVTAGWAGPARVIPAAMSAGLLYLGLKSLGLLYLQVGDFVRVTLLALIVFTTARALARAFLQPRRPLWRLVDLADPTAMRLATAATGIAGLYGIDMILREMIRGLFLPLSVSIAEASLASIGFAAFLLMIVATPFLPLTARDDPVSIWRPRVLKWPLVAIAIAVVAASLLGYISLARFIAGQVVLTGTVAISILLLHLAARAVASLPENPTSKSEGFFKGRLTLADEQQRRLVSNIINFTLNLLLAVAAIPVLLLSFGFTSADIYALADQALFGFEIGGFHIAPARILTAIGLFLALIFATRLVQRGLSKSVLHPSRSDPGIANSVQTGIGYAGVLVAALAAVSYGGLDITNLAIVAGALSVGIGFGLQSIVNNFVSGLILLVERPIQVGDWIQVGEVEGHVRRISVRSTEIETFERASIIVPNSELISTSVTNLTHRNALGRVTIEVGVSYDSDPIQVREILETVAKECTKVLQHPAPLIVFENFGDSALEFSLRAYIADVNSSLSTRTELRTSILLAFREAGIEIPYPHIDLKLRDSGDLQGSFRDSPPTPRLAASQPTPKDRAS